MEENKKGNTGLVTLLVIFIIISLGLGCYIGYDKLLSNDNCITEETTKTETKEENIEETTIEETTKEETPEEETTTKETTTEKNESSKAKCYGTYYVNGNQSEGTYTFNEDGTWQVENSEQGGVFTINENTITMIEAKHNVGPREEDPYYYNPKSYLISDDCSRIRLTESGSHTSAYLQKVN